MKTEPRGRGEAGTEERGITGLVERLGVRGGGEGARGHAHAHATAWAAPTFTARAVQEAELPLGARPSSQHRCQGGRKLH